MLVLMYRKGNGGEGKAEGGLIHLTSVNICVRTYVSPLLGTHCVCVISVSVAAHTVRMRNFCCFICFSFAVFLPVSASVMQCYDFYTFTHICRCLCPALVFRFFLWVFLRISIAPWTALLITSQSIGGSFMFAHFNIFRLFKCSFFTMP